jgi:hypothetical protein
MNRWNSLTSETAFDTASSNESYLEHTNRPDLVGACPTQPSEAPSILSDTYFDQIIACYNLSTGFLSESPEVSTTTSVAAANLDVDLSQFPHAECASLRRTSSTSSLGSSERANDSTCSPDYESLSQMPTGAEPSPKRRMKTQGRPKQDPIATHVPGAPNESQPTTRIPHNTVERKYREGLNTELERLRRAVPTLLQSHEGSGIGQSKPSKSMVIAAAINHIEMIENERNVLQKENDELREFQKQNGGSRGRRGLKKRRVDLISEWTFA